MTIPKIFHHIWIGNKALPSKQVEWRNHMLSLHPDWEYRLWDDSNTEELKPLLDRTSKGSAKANVVRVWAVLNHGGVYADTDFEWFKPITPLIQGIHGFCCKESPRWYANGLFGSVPESSWLKRIWDSMPEYVGEQKIPWGPKQFTRLIRNTEITTFPTEYFYPYPFSKRRNRRVREAVYPNAYAAHHWAMSWRQ